MYVCEHVCREMGRRMLRKLLRGPRGQRVLVLGEPWNGAERWAVDMSWVCRAGGWGCLAT